MSVFNALGKAFFNESFTISAAEMALLFRD